MEFRGKISRNDKLTVIGGGSDCGVVCGRGRRVLVHVGGGGGRRGGHGGGRGHGRRRQAGQLLAAQMLAQARPAIAEPHLHSSLGQFGPWGGRRG